MMISVNWRKRGHRKGRWCWRRCRSRVVGAGVAVAFGYTDPVAVTTIGGGAATYIVGPVTGTALGAVEPSCVMFR